MAPNLTGSATGLFLAEAELISEEQTKGPVKPHAKPRQEVPQYHWHIVWRNLIAFIYLHTAALYGLYLLLTLQPKLLTGFWSIFVAFCTGLGITAGAHRLWAHKSYKATWQLRLLLSLFQAAAFQNHIYEWVRDHRVHHKFCDTDADPHNSKRGFFFSHIGWLMVKKHKDVRLKGQAVIMSDLETDWVVMWQKKYYAILMPLLCFVFPVWVPWYLWGEAGWTSWYVAGTLRYTLTLNGTWLVNSAAHIWGARPYDKTISPTDNVSVAVLAFGEGWHNYHHAFPWDYKTSELGGYRTNFTKMFIDVMSKIGWAYDLKTAPLDMIKKRAHRIGDGSKYKVVEGEEEENHHKGEIWGWDDSDMPKEEQTMATIIGKKQL